MKKENNRPINYQSIRTTTPSPSPPLLDTDTNMHQPQHHDEVDARRAIGGGGRSLSSGIETAMTTAMAPPSHELFHRQADRIPELSPESTVASGNLFGDATSFDSSTGGGGGTDNAAVSQSHSGLSQQHQQTAINNNNNNNNNNNIIPPLNSSAVAGGGQLSPVQLHAEYSHRLHQAHVRAGHRNIVVGGTHGRYRDFNGTLIEVPMEVFAVRKKALGVFYPLTFCWLILTIGFSISAGLAAARFTGKLYDLPYWAIFLPAWLSHLGIFIMHISSAMALSKFINEANANRQQPNSTDHLDRVEYLSLLQRSIKFGVKTGVLCFIVLIFEILLCIRLYNSSAISMGQVYIPLWILTVTHIANGIVCKSQHLLQSLFWVLLFTAMLLSVLIVDYSMESISWGVIIALIIALLLIVTGVLIHVVYGHQIGYFLLTDSQLTAGVFYSISSMLAILVVAIIGGAIKLPEIIQLDLFLITIFLAPFVVALAGLGAYLVTRDEYVRLLRDGGQSLNTPMRLRLEEKGWNSVVDNGVASIPMFGDVKYKPLDSAMTEMLSIDLFWICCCSHFYNAVLDEEPNHYYARPIRGYQSPTNNARMSASTGWGGTEEPIV